MVLHLLSLNPIPWPCYLIWISSHQMLWIWKRMNMSTKQNLASSQSQYFLWIFDHVITSDVVLTLRPPPPCSFLCLCCFKPADWWPRWQIIFHCFLWRANISNWSIYLHLYFRKYWLVRKPSFPFYWSWHWIFRKDSGQERSKAKTVLPSQYLQIFILILTIKSRHQADDETSSLV